MKKLLLLLQNKKILKNFATRCLMYLGGIFFIINFLCFILAFLSMLLVSEKQNEVMRLVVYGSSDEITSNTVSANIVLLDTSSNDIATIERSWTGKYLSVDFIEVDGYNNKYFFPWEIKTYSTYLQHEDRKPVSRGTKLKKYYSFGSKSNLLSKSVVNTIGERLIEIYISLPISRVLPFFSKKISVNLANCEYGITYGIYLDENTLSLRED